MGLVAKLTAALTAAALIAPAAAHAEPVSLCNVPIPMSDGVVLRANVFLPAESGRFPAALTVTGYNKDATNPVGANCSPSGGLASGDPALLEAGYAIMLVDGDGKLYAHGTSTCIILGG